MSIVMEDLLFCHSRLSAVTPAVAIKQIAKRFYMILTKRALFKISVLVSLLSISEIAQLKLRPQGCANANTHIVICGIFDSCHSYHQYQRHNGGEPGQGGDFWNQLKQTFQMV